MGAECSHHSDSVLCRRSSIDIYLGIVQPGSGHANVITQRNENDTIDVTLSVGPMPFEAAFALTEVVVTAFNRYRLGRLVDSLEPAMAEFYRQRDSTLLRLEAVNTRMLEANEEFRRTLEEQTAKRTVELEAEWRAKSGALEAEHQTRVAGLDQRAEALDRLKKELDDRNNTHARRQHQKDLNEKVRSRSHDFALSQRTATGREHTQWLLFLLTTVMAGSSVWSLVIINSVPPGMPAWLGLLRAGLVLGGFVGTIVYFVRWRDSWTNAHAGEEFRLKRLDLDIDRASWLVETLLEFRGDNGAELPRELVERLAAGLFESRSQLTVGAEHPLEQAVRAIAATATGVKIGPAGLEASYDGKALKKTNQEA